MPLLERLTDLPGLKREGVFTHFSSAGQSAQVSEQQMESYRRLLEKMSQRHYAPGLRHLANSVGMIRFPESHWDMVRTGLLLYGASPIKENQPFFLEPALALKSRIRFVKRIEPPRTISYGGTFKAEKSTIVGTIPVGYAHGYPRALSNKAQLLVRGVRVPVIGKITMEDLMVDLTAVPEAMIGDEVVLIGRQGNQRITAEELALHARTIPYEIFVGLSANLPRISAGAA
jgi:alanine racemase